MDYNTIIIGGGHNGLICAAELAQAGHSVLVVEARERLGGAAVLSNDAGLLAPEVLEALNLDIEWVEPETAVFAPQPDGRALTLHTKLDKSVASIAQFSARDAERFPEFVRAVKTLTAALEPYLAKPVTPADMGQLMLNEPELLRVGTLPAAEWLRHYFESDALLGLLGSVSVTHLTQGPYSQGTGLMFLYQMLMAGEGGYKRVRFARGGMDNLVAALAQKVEEKGAEIKTGTAVTQILLDNSTAIGVKLADDIEITAERIISTLTPKQTMFGLVGAPQLPPSVVRRIKNGLYRGSTAKLNLTLNERPTFKAHTAPEQLHGQIVISPSLEYLEKAFDATKYGRIAQKPYLNMRLSSSAAGTHMLAITMQYAPYHLRHTTWNMERGTLTNLIFNTLETYLPNIRNLITHQQLWTPLDLEEQFGLTDGSVMQGQMELAQMFALRGGGGNSIANLVLAGAATHPGGGLTGRPGYLAARSILQSA